MSELEESGGEEDVALAHFLPFPLSYPKLGSSSNYRHLISLVCPSHSTSDHLPTSLAMGKAARRRPMSASSEPHAWRSGHGHGAGGLG